MSLQSVATRLADYYPPTSHMLRGSVGGGRYDYSEAPFKSGLDAQHVFQMLSRGLAEPPRNQNSAHEFHIATVAMSKELLRLLGRCADVIDEHLSEIENPVLDEQVVKLRQELRAWNR